VSKIVPDTQPISQFRLAFPCRAISRRIVGASLGMSALAWIGVALAALGPHRLQVVALPLVAFAGGIAPRPRLSAPAA
jgi:hypothetical protein